MFIQKEKVETVVLSGTVTESMTAGQHRAPGPRSAHLLRSRQLNLQVSDDRLILVLPLRQLFAGQLQLCQSALQLLAALPVSALQLLAQLLALLLESALHLEDTSMESVMQVLRIQGSPVTQHYEWSRRDSLPLKPSLFLTVSAENGGWTDRCSGSSTRSEVSPVPWSSQLRSTRKSQSRVENLFFSAI